MKTGTATETKMPPVKPREQQSESAEKVVIKVGQKFWKGDKIYSYAGVVKDAKSKDFGKPTVKLEGKDLYEVWT
ncbi:MAG: hypothetical protein HYW78_02815, partial [Parcubacteria group bacterium]|nr:hypothetical protein [Parcubacteria group bacterium]